MTENGLRNIMLMLVTLFATAAAAYGASSMAAPALHYTLEFWKAYAILLAVVYAAPALKAALGGNRQGKMHKVAK